MGLTRARSLVAIIDDHIIDVETNNEKLNFETIYSLTWAALENIKRAHEEVQTIWAEHGAGGNRHG